MLVKDILKDVRFTLSDANGARWSDERLISLLNNGLTDIAKNTILFVDTIFVELVDSQTDYDLSDFAVKIVYVEYEDKELYQSSFAEMNKKCPTWQQVEGDKAKAYVLDKQREANLKIYPKIKNGNIANIDFGSGYGIITGITYSELQLNSATLLGDLGAVEQDGFVKVYYIQKHPTLSDIADEILISDIAKEMLGHYIAGRALRDNQDTQSRSLGNEEYNMYKMQLEEYNIIKAKNFAQANFFSSYNPTGA